MVVSIAGPDEIIHKAEAAKVHVFSTAGNDQLVNQTDMVDKQKLIAQHLAVDVDQNYIVVGSHLNQSLIDKIKRLY